MGVFGGPEIPNDGLVLALDGANYKSFKGESVTNLYYAEAASSANNSIFHMPMGGTATGSYTTSSYGSWSGNTIFKVIVSAGTLSGGYESFRSCVSGSFTSTYGTSRRLSAKVKMLKGSITSLGLHNGGGTSGHSSGHYTPISEFSVPTDVLSKDGWYQFDVDVSGSWGSHCVGIGIVGSDIEFLVTEMMLYPSLTFVRFTPTTRGTTVATGGGWADLIGNGNNGELVNGVRESSANGGSLSFDGTDDYILGTIPSSTFSGAHSIGCWFFRETVTEWASLFSNNVNTTSCSIFTFITNTNTLGANQAGVDGTPVSAVDLGADHLNKWIYAVITYSGVTSGSAVNVYAYKNGSLLTATGSLYWNLSSSSSYYIGRHWTSASQILDGFIPQVSVYNRALSAAEVSQNFIATRSRYGI